LFVFVCLQRQEQCAHGENEKNGEDFAEGFKVVHVVQLVGEASENVAVSLHEFPVGNVGTVIRPIGAGGTIIGAKPPDFRRELVA
jgi:hypothetical protein